MPEEDVLQTLSTFNTHWADRHVSALIKKSPKRRRAFVPQRERLKRLPFQVLAGPRQVGKTTLVGHLIEDLLDQGVQPSHILYVPLDIPRIAAEAQGRLEPILRAYERFILQRKLGATDDVVYLFLDEVQALNDWAIELKALYDQYHPKLRVFATGSSSAALINPETADLPGRVDSVRMYPLKFAEFLEARHPEELGGFVGSTSNAAKAARTALGLFDGSPTSRNTLYEELENVYRQAASQRPTIEAAFDQYLLRGGYPLAAFAESAADAFRFHQATIDTMLSKDLKLYPKVRKPAAFQSFLALLARDHGGKFNASRYAQDLQVDKESPAHWKAITEDLFLAHQLPPMSESLQTVPRKADKAYIQDPGLRAFLAVKTDLAEIERSGEIGQVVEGVLFDHMRRLQFNLFGHRNGVIGYWTKPEVDLIVQLPKAWLLIESRYAARPRVRSHALGEVAALRKNPLAVLASRAEFKLADPVVTVPAWMLALLA